MKQTLVLPILSVLAGTAFAGEGDLTLPGEKWIATFNHYVCSETTPAAVRPAALDALDVQFERITTDASLDNVLLKATFTEDGKTCRYNAILFADNAARTVRLVESKAYASAGDEDCADGRALLDEKLQGTDYLYYGHPHNVAIMLPVDDAAALCGEGAEAVGVNFVVSGRVQPPSP